jgi:5-(aminomethyl)-3-furanmethanol phosphate kinase
LSAVANKDPLVVVKLGGSLLGTPRLDQLVRTILSCNRTRIVIVCGGGLFADGVRAAQQKLGFSDALAHRLALDAMRWVGETIVDRHPELSLVEDASLVAGAHAAGRIPLWTAAELRGGHRDIDENWDITSDSLSAWLAARLGAEMLVLIKSAEVPRGEGPLQWVSQGIVDGAFARFVERFRGEVTCIGPADDARLVQLVMPARARARGAA